MMRITFNLGDWDYNNYVEVNIYKLRIKRINNMFYIQYKSWFLGRWHNFPIESEIYNHPIIEDDIVGYGWFSHDYNGALEYLKEKLMKQAEKEINNLINKL